MKSHSHETTCSSKCSHEHNHNEIDYNLPDNGSTSLIDSFFSSVRYGLKTSVERILKENPDIVNQKDLHGCTGVHWAARKGDVEMLAVLYQYGGKLNEMSISESKMQPIHWAASEGMVQAIAFFIEHREDINSQDASGSTPVIIATQHNHHNCVIYLIQNGADMTLCDSNGDTAYHWAAYKGYVEMIGLLSYLLPYDTNKIDAYGQTPLHLAAMRGYPDVVEYLLYQCDADHLIKDKNGLTPLDLSIQKQQLKTEWILRRYISKSWFHLVSSIPASRFNDNRILKNLLFGSNERETAAWAWRVVFLSNLFGTIYSCYYAIDSELSDLYLLHVYNTIVQSIWWILFICCLMKSPGIVTNDDNEFHGYSYAKMIKEMKSPLIAASSTPDINVKNNNNSGSMVVKPIPALCHSCHICKPIRSKHCRNLNRCVHKFDHFCPFVGNTIGRDNYKFFVTLLFTYLLCGIGFLITAAYKFRRSILPITTYLFIVYTLGWIFMMASLLDYHVRLMSQNLTTNEHMKMGSYAYFRDNQHMFKNPFCKGSFMGNVIDSLFPSTRNYYHRSEIIPSSAAEV